MSSSLRVLDLADVLAFQAARLFVGMGADVVRVVPPGEMPLAPSEEWHWHAGKRVQQVHTEADYVTRVRELAAGADVVLESGPIGRLRTPALRDQEGERWRSVVHVLVTPFGRTGPRCDWTADDVVLAAAGGMAWLGGDPEGEPEPPPRQQAVQTAGAHAAIGALLALVARRRTGRGQLVEVSAQEAVAATLETGAISWIHGRAVPGRTSGIYSHVAHRVFTAADGHVAGGYSGSPRMWEDLLAWMVEEGEAEDLADAEWQDVERRWQGRPHVDEVVARFVSRRTAAEMSEQARIRGLPWAEVTSADRLTDNPQLAHRRFMVEIQTPDGAVSDVGFPFESPARPRPVRLSTPQVIASGDAWLEPPAKPHRGDGACRDAGRGALTGVRVLDLTWVLAGPYATKILGEHGADVVKVESCHRKDPTRFAPGMRLRAGASFDDSGYFLNFNRNKRSIALNLRTARGQQLLRELVPHVDVVVENFSPGVLDRWGLGFEQMRLLNDDVVLVSMAGVGQTGPWCSAVTFADTLAAMSGLTFETGRKDRPPQGLTFGLGDMVAANAAVIAALELLHSGRAGHVDLSQLEAMAAHLGAAALEPQVGHGVPDGLPPRVVPARGEDRWLAVGGCRVEQLRAAVASLSSDGFSDVYEALVDLAQETDADELAVHLQLWGIPAYPVRDGRDLVEVDPQLRERRFYVPLDHSLAGRVLHEGIVEHLSDTPGALHCAAPLLGQHTDELLTELLGLSASDLVALRENGVLE